MRSLRQLGGGVIIALVSVLLVIGGISLALAETLPSQSTPTPIPPTVSFDFPTATFTAAGFFSDTPATSPTALIIAASETPSITPVNTMVVQAACNPPAGWLSVITVAGDTVYSLAQRYKTTAENLAAANCLTSFDIPVGFTLYVPPVPTVTVIPCGPPAGYVKKHLVQPGETLYRIALSYGITFPQLQRANCMGSSTTIYVGQLLWVPNISTLTPVPGITVIPNFPTTTYTPIPTDTIVPPTSTYTTVPTTPPTFTPSYTPPSPAAQ